MLPFQVFVPDPVGTKVIRDPTAESKLLNVTGLEDVVMSHVGFPLKKSIVPPEKKSNL